MAKVSARKSKLGSAKREATRTKRITQMTRELKSGKAYMGMRYRAKEE
jgi:hypothetical protein